MKLSLKLQEQSETINNHLKQPQTQPLLLRAKIPISIFNLPFLSCFSTITTHPSDLSLSLATSFPSGPTLKLSYSTASPTTPTTPPLTLTLKSGIGVFGSPNNSPLVISANFSFSPLSPNQNPTFTLLFRPQLGSFSLRKSTTSGTGCGNSSAVGKQNGDENSFGFVPLERPSSFKEFSMEDYAKDSVFKGIAVMAKTEMPLTKRVMMDCRWGVKFPKDLGNRMPFLSVNKIRIKRVEEVKGVKEKKDNENSGENELLKGMCFWMKKELEMLQRENREMKHRVEEMKMGNVAGRKGVGEGDFVGVQVVESSAGFEQWRNKRNSGVENAKKEVKKASNGSRASDVESELQKAIRAASSS
ncbi:unnamed protein product [Withania somnifera]